MRLTVSTPDHTHAPAAMMAMHKGIHVYVQKPMTHTGLGSSSNDNACK
jgi:predicted dehydrogenase